MARPTLDPDGEATKSGSIRLTAEEWAAVDVLAERRGLTRAALLRRMVQRVLEGEGLRKVNASATSARPKGMAAPARPRPSEVSPNFKRQ